jgi:molecular chaperone HscB
MIPCPRCSKPTETPLGCLACGTLFDLENDPDPFTALGLEPGFRIDKENLRRRVLRLSRLVHPDFFATAGEAERARAERASAILNAAHATVSDDVARADQLVEILGGPSEDAERAMPKEFLLEVLEWNEFLEEARASRSVSDEKLQGLRRELGERRSTAIEAVSRLLEPLPAHEAPGLREARRELNAIRYVDRALGDIEALQLSRAEAR